MSPHFLDFLTYEETLLSMALFKPAILRQLRIELFDEPGNRAVLEALFRLRDRGEEITPVSARREAGKWANAVPAPWFTVANISFYLAALEGRRQVRERRARLLDELRAIDEGQSLGAF